MKTERGQRVELARAVIAPLWKRVLARLSGWSDREELLREREAEIVALRAKLTRALALCADLNAENGELLRKLGRHTSPVRLPIAGHGTRRSG